MHTLHSAPYASHLSHDEARATSLSPENNSPEGEAEAPAQRAYQRPTVELYGSVAAITAGSNIFSDGD